MLNLTQDHIASNLADSNLIFERGCRLYEHGGYICVEEDRETGEFVYDVDGNYGDYTTRVRIVEDVLDYSCDCPYPRKGCKHTVAVMLDIRDKLEGCKDVTTHADLSATPTEEEYLTPEEIKEQALKDRKKRAVSEEFKIIPGDMYKGEHLLETVRGNQYQVTLHDPRKGVGHCSCPDFATNHLGTCKHIIFLSEMFGRKRGFINNVEKERFPFIDIFWDSNHNRPRLFNEMSTQETGDIADLLAENFDDRGCFFSGEPEKFLTFVARLKGDKRVRIQEAVFQKIDDRICSMQSEGIVDKNLPSLSFLKTKLYPYQKEGVDFGLHKHAVLIGDEMGLGKTLQAIALAVLKKELYGFNNILVVTLASLKEQWKREIERFTSEKAVIVAGTASKRQEIYTGDASFFKITNYEAVLRDVTIISRLRPDLVILDEAQRIKNFNTKTADAVKRLPRKHAMVLTGTPLENKLEDVYSIVQFLEPGMLSPLWQFAADHFMLSRKKKGRILGYRNLDLLHNKLKSIVIRRRKEEVLSDLPEEVVNNYYLNLTVEQAEIHAGYAQLLMPLLNKKFLTPLDHQRIMMLLLKMRRVCDSTYLVDRDTNISPKLKELEGILDELVIQNKRKVVLFSEWTTMTYLIAKRLSQNGISFVELSGKIPVKKRQALIDEFTHNPDCNVFLSTDAGGTGLNLQAADCVINFELPWNPSRINQRVGRVNRIGQKSRCVNVVNLITKNSIEEKILAGLQLKADLFEGVFDGGKDTVEFSQAKRTELLNRLRAMLGEEEGLFSEERASADEIPEETPHFLNPQALSKEEEVLVAYDAEEGEDTLTEAVDNRTHMIETCGNGERSPSGASKGPSPEKMEQVLNTGMQFISGLMEVATGRKMVPASEDRRMIRVNRETGEVTMKFKLPGF